MMNIEKRQYSPLFKIKKILYLLRWVFGFPLISTNDSFSEFEFKFWIELLRHILYICSGWTALGYVFYIFSKYATEDNPWLAYTETMRRIGYSDLDIATWMCMPFVGAVSNTIYFCSFKRALGGINTVSRCLTKLNEEFRHHLASCNFESLKYETKVTRLKNYVDFAWVIAFGAIAIGMFTYFLSSMIFEMYPEDLTVIDKVTFVIAIITAATTYVYPPMAMSADAVVCCLIEETQNVFGKFKMVIAPRNKLSEEDKYLHLTHLILNLLKDTREEL